jgi:hypothetical protein
MALVSNTNVALPSTFDTSLPSTWTHLVSAEVSPLSPEDQAIASAAAANALATAALETAWAGTEIAYAAGTTADAAYDIALVALDTAWAGTTTADLALATALQAIAIAGTETVALAISTANLALTTAWAGTSAAVEARAVAQTALETAWIGTNSTGAQAIAQTALETSWAGTSAAVEAYNTAITALATSWAGTSAAVAAYDTASTALTTSWAGTSAAVEAYNTANTALATAWSGTSAAVAAYNIGNAAYTLASTGTGGVTGPASSQSNAIAAWFDASSGSLVSSPALVDNYGDITILNPLNPSQEQLWAGWSGNTYKIQSQITRPAVDRDIEIHTSGSGALNFKTSGFPRIAMNSGGIFPGASNLYDLGSNGLQWRQLHVAASAYFYGGALYLGSSFDTPLIRDDIGKLSLRSIGAGGPKFEFRINDGFTNSGTYSRLTVGTNTSLFNGTTHVIMSEMAGQNVGATTYQLLPITLSATPGLRNQHRLNTDGSHDISGDVRTTAGTLSIQPAYTSAAGGYVGLLIDQIDTASASTARALSVRRANGEIAYIHKLGGFVTAGAAGAPTAGVQVSLEATGGWIQSYGGQQLNINPLGNKVAVNTASPNSMFEIGQSWARTGTLVTNDIILGLTQNVVICNATEAPILVSLPTTGGGTPATNRIYTVKKSDASGNAVTLKASDDERIEGDNTLILSSQYQSREVICVSGTWHVLAGIG